MAETLRPVMREDYYVSNFHTLVGFVVDTYADILKEEEFQWYAKLQRVSPAAQRLYIRLLTRKRSTFRISRLQYPEINDLKAAAAELTESGLATSAPPDNLSALLTCFTKPELGKLLDLSQLRHASRAALTEYVENSAPDSQARFTELLLAADDWVSIDGYQHWMLMQLCFFGNLYQDSSELVLRQLGTLRYEDYPLDCACRAFTSREQIDAHWRYFECETLYECTDQGNATELSRLADSLPKPCANDVNLRRRLDRIRNRIARQLERLSRVEEATTLYKASVHPPARERRVRILMAKQQWPHALTLARQMCDEAYNESERLTGLTLFARCQQALDIAHIKTRPFKPATTRLVLRSDGSRVEELARRFYANTGACFHTENTLINGVLGLFIWDIMFHPVPGVFFNPFQMAPADFNEPEFCARRADLFARRFAELDDQDSLRARVLESFEQHAGKQNPLVRWQRLSPDMLVLALDRIPRDHWRALFERILADTRENSTGLPDLVLFPRAGGYEFIEIKGPGDALQANQRRWMQYFDQNNIACRLVHVRYRL